jgi:hypothetical protein
VSLAEATWQHGDDDGGVRVIGVRVGVRVVADRHLQEEKRGREGAEQQGRQDECKKTPQHSI